MPPKILIAGIGNIFFGDDAFGVEVARRLAVRPLPEGVRVVDFGIRGFDLTFALLEDDDAVVLVDAVPKGGVPGTLYLIEPEPADEDEPDPGEWLLDPHSLDPAKVLRAVKALGGRAKHILVVGCEPTPINDEADIEPGLSEPVQSVLDDAIAMIETLIDEIRADHQKTVERSGPTRSTAEEAIR